MEELLSKNKQSQQINEEDEESAPPWRFGPAQIWYDRLGVPSNPANFDYGMKRGKMFTSIDGLETPGFFYFLIFEKLYLIESGMDWVNEKIDAVFQLRSNSKFCVTHLWLGCRSFKSLFYLFMLGFLIF